MHRCCAPHCRPGDWGCTRSSTCPCQTGRRPAPPYHHWRRHPPPQYAAAGATEHNTERTARQVCAGRFLVGITTVTSSVTGRNLLQRQDEDLKDWHSFGQAYAASSSSSACIHRKTNSSGPCSCVHPKSTACEIAHHDADRSALDGDFLPRIAP